jgi:hypothetical protein
MQANKGFSSLSDPRMLHLEFGAGATERELLSVDSVGRPDCRHVQSETVPRSPCPMDFLLSVANWPSLGNRHCPSRGKSCWPPTLRERRNEKSGRPRALLLRSVVLAGGTTFRGSAKPLSCPFMVHVTVRGHELPSCASDYP